MYFRLKAKSSVTMQSSYRASAEKHRLLYHIRIVLPRRLYRLNSHSLFMTFKEVIVRGHNLFLFSLGVTTCFCRAGSNEG